jgi:hypothetical protein
MSPDHNLALSRSLLVLTAVFSLKALDEICQRV